MFSFTQKMNRIANSATRSPKVNSTPKRRNWAHKRHNVRHEMQPLTFNMRAIAR